ncbi:MAG: CocE/NonD family hydrolase [Pseudomonadota bacterium]
MTQGHYDLDFGVSIPINGIALNANLLLPRAAEPSPALLTITPYSCDFAYNRARVFAQAGFAVAIVEARGRGNSQGAFDLYNDGDDGAACVEWLAGQPFCNGAVALFGGSYAGLNQWQIAARKPAGLKAIAPVCGPMPGFDADGYGGLFPLYNVRWSTFVRGRTLHPAILADDAYWTDLFARHYEGQAGVAKTADLLGGADAVVQRMLSDEAFDVPTLEALSDLTIPALTITGTVDNAQRGALEFHRRYARARPDAPNWAVIGPWNHAGSRDPGGVDEGQALETYETDLLVDFYKWALSGDHLPARLQSTASIYVAGCEKWVESSSLDAPAVREVELIAHNDAATPICPSGALIKPEVSLFDVLGGEASVNALCEDAFETAAHWTIVTQDQARLIGQPIAEIDIVVEQSDADVALVLVESRKDGTVIVLSSAQQRFAVGAHHAAQLDFRFAARQLQSGSQLTLYALHVDDPDFQRPDPTMPSLVQLASPVGLRLFLPITENAS